jgi:endo-1,4-beta-xylanase
LVDSSAVIRFLSLCKIFFLKYSAILVLLCFVFINFFCSKHESSIASIPQSDTTPLKNIAPFKVGASIVVPLLQNDSLYRNTVLQQYNSITTANTLKWYIAHPSENVFDFSGGDYIADFSAANSKRMHAHCLIWYFDNPDWLNNFSGDSLAWENLFKTHIQTMVAHYKGKATSWDVVNEALNDDGSLRVNDKNLSNNYDDGSIWARHLGPDYVARAFIYAHEADTSALLFYNDYGQEWDDRKTDSIIAMINRFKARGIPVNGLGLQMHTNITASQDGIKKAFQKAATTGLLIHISELDVGVNPSNDRTVEFSEALAQKQANLYSFIVQQYKHLIPEKQQYGITTWDVSDADSWLVTELKRKDWPLLFDTNFIKKPAYFSFRNALVN